MLADSVGLALLVVLETLAPAERLAFVLHDMFAVPFDEIAPIVGRSPAAARQLASRARRRVRGARCGALPPICAASGRSSTRSSRRSRGGDFEGAYRRARSGRCGAGRARAPGGAERDARGRAGPGSAIAFARLAQFVRPALVDGAVGVVHAPGGRLSRALRFTFKGGKIVEVNVIADPARLKELECRSSTNDSFLCT